MPSSTDSAATADDAVAIARNALAWCFEALEGPSSPGAQTYRGDPDSDRVALHSMASELWHELRSQIDQPADEKHVRVTAVAELAVARALDAARLCPESVLRAQDPSRVALDSATLRRQRDLTDLLAAQCAAMDEVDSDACELLATALGSELTLAAPDSSEWRWLATQIEHLAKLAQSFREAKVRLQVSLRASSLHPTTAALVRFRPLFGLSRQEARREGSRDALILKAVGLSYSAIGDVLLRRPLRDGAKLDDARKAWTKQAQRLVTQARLWQPKTDEREAHIFAQTCGIEVLSTDCYSIFP
jgi:hypothetical protein